MDLRQIRYFVQVADLRNITRASTLLHISQPALSRQMYLLERELGTKLFRHHRHRHGLVLTSDGLLFLDHCNRLLQQFEEVQKLFSRERNASGLTGAVGIGMPIPVIQMFASPFISDFSEAYPGIFLRMAEGFSALLHEWLLSGSMDLAVLYCVPASKDLVPERLVVEDLYLLAPADAPFARTTTPLYLREIGETPMILPHRPHVLRHIADQTGFSPKNVIEVDALTLMVELVRKGKGVTLLSKLAYQQLSDDTVIAIPLADSGMKWDVTLCYSASRPLSEAAKEVHRAVCAEVRRLVSSGRWPATLTA